MLRILPQSHRQNARHLFELGLLFLACLSALLCCVTVFRTSLHLMDSESSADMMLAYRIFRTHKWLPNHWYLDAEHEMLGNYLAFVPFFSIFSDWRKVRFFGTLLQIGCLLFSFLYLCKKAKFSRVAQLLGISLLLLPTSLAYGRNVLYHTDDIPYIIISFLLIAFLLSLWEDLETKSPLHRRIIYGICLLLTAFAGGLNHFRQAAVLLLPFLFVCLIQVVRDRSTLKTDPIKQQIYFLIVPAIIACFIAGWMLRAYLTETHTTMAVADPIKGDWILWGNQLLYSYMHTLGFRHRATVTSVYGLLGIASLGTILILTWRGLHFALRKEYPMPNGARFSSMMYPAGIISMLIVSFITPRGSDGWFWLPAYLWALPFLLAWISYPLPKGYNVYRAKHPLLVLFVCCIMLLNGFANTLTFLQPSRFTQYYDGGKWFFINTADYLEPLRAHLMDNHYTKGYCTSNIGNVLSELSSGHLDTVTIHIAPDGNLSWVNHLTDTTTRNEISQKPFLVIEWAYREAFETSPARNTCIPLMEGVDFVAYEVIDEEAFIALINDN